MPVHQPPGATKAQRRRKAPTLREHDWEPLKTRIVDLHVNQNRPLPEVRALMQREHGFEATLRQYRSRVSAWGFDKNIKSKEMKFIVGRHKRKLAESPPKARYVFRVRGKIVPLAKIQRWMERSEADNDEDAESETSMETPSDISYWEDDETAEGTPESGHSNEDHPSKNSKRKMIQQQIAEERNPYSEAVRGAMASLVRHRQPAVRDTPVASLQDLYNHTDLSTLLGSLEIDDVLVGPYTADDGERDAGQLHTAGPHEPDSAEQVLGPDLELVILQQNNDYVAGLVHVFFNSAHPFVPVLDKEDFLRRFNEDRFTIPVHLQSAIFSLSEGLNGGSPETAQRWFNAALYQMSLLDGAPGLATLQALLILIKAKESLPKKNYYFDAWLEISKCNQMAQSLGLHTHSARHVRGESCSLALAECTLWRRIWQTIYVVEVMISYPKAYSSLTVPIETVDFMVGQDAEYLKLEKDDCDFTYFARLVRDIKDLYSTYLFGKMQNAAPNAEFQRHSTTLQAWLTSLPSRLVMVYPEDESPPLLQSAYAGHLHAFYYMGVIMLNRVQLPLFERQHTDPLWLSHMLVCHAAAKLQCRLHEAIVLQYELQGVQYMQRGANFTIYCVLLGVVVHLAALSSPEPSLHVGAAKYLTRHMRALEKCQDLWPSTELSSQVDRLRELLSADTSKEFALKEGSWQGATVADSAVYAPAPELMNNWLGMDDNDWNDVNTWFDAFI